MDLFWSSQKAIAMMLLMRRCGARHGASLSLSVLRCNRTRMRYYANNPSFYVPRLP